MSLCVKNNIPNIYQMIEIGIQVVCTTMTRSWNFVDLFAGCGGLSLGLLRSGWNGLFAIEKNSDAFNALKTNLIDPQPKNRLSSQFNWPDWLPINPYSIEELNKTYSDKLLSMRGELDLVVGGPPCQGFSLAGKRRSDDHRNHLFEEYLKFVELTQPKIILMENVRGIALRFNSDKPPYSELIKQGLEELEYQVASMVLDASDYGVPQRRKRYFIYGIRKDGLFSSIDEFPLNKVIQKHRFNFLVSKGLDPYVKVSAEDACSDLLTEGFETKDNVDTKTKGYKELVYNKPITPYQVLMNRHCGPNMDSMRLAKHRSKTIERFEQIHKFCDKGVCLSKEDREKFNMKKASFTPLAANMPAPTITTLPDDQLHYCESRIHTVRENARFQSFPDWFKFTGPYTTGGHRRKSECPRYTQVGNAVPPLLSEIIGYALLSLCSRSKGET